jgi:hypothetical protein
MSLEDAIKSRLAGKSPERPGDPPKRKTAAEIVEELTPRQREVLYDALVERGGFFGKD